MATLNTGNRTEAPRAASTFFAATAIACFVLFAFALLLVHALRPDRVLTTTWISSHAVGRNGWIMTTAWLVASVGCLMLVLGLIRSGLRSVVARVGTLLLGVLAAGFVVAAIFPPGPTLAGDIHSMGFLVNVVCILFSSILLSVACRHDARWRSFQRTAVILAALLVIAFVLQFVTAFLEVMYGLVNRLFVTVLIAWLLALSIRLRTLSGE
jgi:hypothetical protein